jgi:polyisoprenyl-phosphate glycosyltransferase
LKKYLFLVPTFNDWMSLNLLIQNLNKELKKNKNNAEVIVVNDCSTQKMKLSLKNLNNISSIKIINLKKNVGSQKAIFIGLNYIKEKNYKTILSILDSDGEDDPTKVNKIIKIAEKKGNSIVVANRAKRNENTYLLMLNKIRLFWTYILTGKYMNFGNFSAFHTKNLKKMLSNNNLWFAYSSGILKNFKKLTYVNINKKKRYYGKSKVNFKFLLEHSFKIICVFKEEIFLRSFFLILILGIINKNYFLESKLTIFFVILNIFFVIYYLINNPNYNVLNLIKNVKKLKT